MKTDHLNELISSLTPTEKRHFKIYSKGHVKGDENKYVYLFNAINATPVNKNATNLLPHSYPLKNLAVEKNYLYNLLLKSLNDFHSDISIESKLDRINKSIEILLNKGLHKHCLTLIKRAKKIANEHQTESQLFRTLELEQELYNKLQNYPLLLSSIEESRAISKKLLNQFDYKQLAFEMNFMEITFRSTNKSEHLKKLHLIIKNELMQNENNAITYKAKMFLFQTKAMYYGIVNDELKSISYFEKMMRLMESAPIILRQHPVDYLLIFANVAMGKINIKNYKELLTDIKKIEQLPNDFSIKNNISVEANLFFFTQPYLLDIYTATGDHNKCKAIIKNIDSKLQTYKPYVIKTIVLNTAKSMAIANFYLEDYKKALKYMNQIFDDDLGKYSRGHIFNMIIHYELGNESLLNSLISSTRRLLIQQDRLNMAEELMIDFFSKLIRIQNEDDIKKHFITYHKKALQLIDDEDANISLRYFNVLKWMESKIKELPLTSI